MRPSPKFRPTSNTAQKKHDVRDRIHLGREIVSVTFDTDSALWITVFADGAVLQSRFVINGVGGLRKPMIPDFDGRETFQGTQMHTAEWGGTFDATCKRIAVIGSAAAGQNRG